MLNKLNLLKRPTTISRKYRSQSRFNPLPKTITDAIPLEIYEIIIDFLHDDRDSLSSCALVCKAWLSASQLHLFHKVTLKRNNYRRFLNFLRKSPEFRDVVHARVHRMIMVQEPRVRRCWSRDCIPYLAGFSIKDLTLDRLNPSDPSNYDMVPPPYIFQYKFQSLTGLNLYMSKFTSLTHLVAMLCAFPTLERVSLDWVTWFRQVEPAVFTLQYSLPPRLQELKLCLQRYDGTLTEFMRWLAYYTGNARLPLQRLSIRSQLSEDDGYRCIHAATRVFAHIGSSLHHLTVANFYDPRAGPIYPALLDSNTEVRTICVCDIDVRWYNPSDYMRQRAAPRIAWIMPFLNQVATTNVEVIKFEISLKGIEDLRLLCWDEMGRLFALREGPQFAGLTRIEIKVSKLEKVVKRWIEARLPLNLVQCGIIHVSRFHNSARS